MCVNPLVSFLRVKEISESPVLWKRLLKPKFVNQFLSIFDRYAIRFVRLLFISNALISEWLENEQS